MLVETGEDALAHVEELATVAVERLHRAAVPSATGVRPRVHQSVSPGAAHACARPRRIAQQRLPPAQRRTPGVVELDPLVVVDVVDVLDAGVEEVPGVAQLGRAQWCRWQQVVEGADQPRHFPSRAPALGPPLLAVARDGVRHFDALVVWHVHPIPAERRGRGVDTEPDHRQVLVGSDEFVELQHQPHVARLPARHHQCLEGLLR